MKNFPNRIKLACVRARSSLLLSLALMILLPLVHSSARAQAGFAITSPPAGSVLQFGQPVTVQWAGGDPAWFVNVLLIEVPPGPFIVRAGVAGNIANTGSYTWTFPASLPHGLEACGRQYVFYVENVQRTSWIYGPQFTVPACAPPNAAPTADAGADQSIHAGSTASLSGAGSFDDNTPTGTLGFAWSFVAKPAGSAAALTNPNSAAPTFIADKTGTYRVQLIVTDEAGLASAADEVVISSLNQAPTANAGADQVTVVSRSLVLNGTASRDPENDPLSYAWSISSSPAGSSATLTPVNSPTPTFVSNIPGTYVVTLSVSDAFGPGVADSATITVDTAADYAAQKVACAADIVRGLAPSQVTNRGNQRAFLKLLGNAVSARQGDHEHADNDDDDRRGADETEERFNVRTALKKLNKAIVRTDGCEARGTADARGEGRDWITDCAAQAPVLACLRDAVDALSTP